MTSSSSTAVVGSVHPPPLVGGRSLSSLHPTLTPEDEKGHRSCLTSSLHDAFRAAPSDFVRACVVIEPTGAGLRAAYTPWPRTRRAEGHVCLLTVGNWFTSTGFAQRRSHASTCAQSAGSGGGAHLAGGRSRAGRRGWSG